MLSGVAKDELRGTDLEASGSCSGYRNCCLDLLSLVSVRAGSLLLGAYGVRSNDLSHAALLLFPSTDGWNSYVTCTARDGLCVSDKTLSVVNRSGVMYIAVAGH